jgi:hypothetical protein
MDKKKTAPKRKQTFIPGTEPPSFPDIDKLADEYVSVRDTRMALSLEEKGKKELLRLKMKAHDLTYYEFDGKTVQILEEESVKVKRKKDDDSDEE